MSEYIKREDAVKALCESCLNKAACYSEEIDIPSCPPFWAMQNIDAADVVEVVRCKDCSRWCICHKSDEYFCADGERRSE